MIERATPQYQARMFIKAEEGGFWHRHHQGKDVTVPNGVALKVAGLQPYVNDGRWLVSCPFCPDAQLASPESDRFFCVSCCNADADGQWLPVQWPEPGFVEAVEAALSARPKVGTRNWEPNESVGALIAENHQAGLVDRENERIAGDIGYDPMALPEAPRGKALKAGS